MRQKRTYREMLIAIIPALDESIEQTQLNSLA